MTRIQPSIPAGVAVLIHPSQFPDAIRRDLRDSLRRRAVNHKFHYDSVKQAQQWLTLHQACSPARTRPGVAATYRRAFAYIARNLGTGSVHVIGLGCADGAKDCALMRRLQDRIVRYTAVDVSTALVLKAWQAASRRIPAECCLPLVCDLAKAHDLPALLDQRTGSSGSRLITFFGMLPNFEPETILPRLAALVRPGDRLLCSANLAPGDDYRKGVEKVLPLYDNTLTRDWLMTFLSDLGTKQNDGTLTFNIEEHPLRSGLLRIAARFRFLRPTEIRIDSDVLAWGPPDVLRLFFSYRHTPGLVHRLMAAHQMTVTAQWISPCGEEGLFLARRASGKSFGS
ncbi:MAG TPA: L-histidine N(alpha)-methyltransferase [Verrucomicrobiota bacterium]|nr:L-histidine N(alpha)-methyltransferase [Verrucomicrobiota bacterium]HNU52406.1 L-histidine N(alpha)-methyltransferase [Verrucomicrobiota bacterium]